MPAVDPWRRGFIAIADRDLWGDSHGVLHGHGTSFNKIWTMGQDYSHAWSQTTNDWNGCFVELQVGVAPTQSHTFTVPKHGSHDHSEYWQLLDGLAEPSRLYAVRRSAPRTSAPRPRRALIQEGGLRL